jgi:uncharacterized protein YdhG (YjbR/CyaY superfamily)
MKTKTAKPRDIDDYISGFPPNIVKALEQVRQTIRKTAPKAQEIIKYNMPAFTLNDNLVYFAAFKHHIGFYPAPTRVPEFKDDLSKYKTGRGSVQFPIDQRMPSRLIAKIVKYRMLKSK